MSGGARAARYPMMSRYRRSIVAGALTAVLVLVGGGAAAVVLASPVQWTHESRLMIVPTPAEGQGSPAGYYETLNSGQLVQTYAEVVRTELQAVLASSAPPEDSESSDGVAALDVQVVPETSILSLRVVSDGADSAQERGTRLAAEAVELVDALGEPFALRDVSGGTGRITPSGGFDLGALAVVGLLAVLAGATVQQLWIRLEAPGTRRRST